MIEADRVPGGVIDQRAIDGARWDVEIAGTRYPARVSLRPLYDPENRRIKG
jgi:4-methylaminobutanoate oxidase (formaldehyde-forming)